MHRVKSILIIAVLLAAAVFSGMTASAAATTDLPAGLLIGDNSGIKAGVDGTYFIDAPNVQPGDVITKTLTILNTEPYSYAVTMTVLPLTETGPVALLDEVTLKLTMDGKILYDGRVRGTDGIDMTKNALDLGTFSSGQQKNLYITLTVGSQMAVPPGTTSDATYQWNFYAVQNAKTAPPKTGDFTTGLYAVLMSSAVLVMAILLLYRQRKGA